jgi:hypothetical protein
MRDSSSDISTEVVPTRTGRPASRSFNLVDDGVVLFAGGFVHQVLVVFRG